MSKNSCMWNWCGGHTRYCLYGRQADRPVGVGSFCTYVTFTTRPYYRDGINQNEWASKRNRSTMISVSAAIAVPSYTRIVVLSYMYDVDNIVLEIGTRAGQSVRKFQYLLSSDGRFERTQCSHIKHGDVLGARTKRQGCELPRPVMC